MSAGAEVPLALGEQLGCACAPSLLLQLSAGELSVNNIFNKLPSPLFFFKYIILWIKNKPDNSVNMFANNLSH